MDPAKAKLGLDGKGALPAYPRLLFFGTRVMPLLFAAGALQIVLLNYFHPMSEEERRELQDRRRGKGASRRPPFSGVEREGSSVATLPEHSPIDDTGLLTNEDAQTLDLSHLRTIHDDSCNTPERGGLRSGSDRDEQPHHSLR